MHQDYRIGIETCMMFLFCIVKISHSFTRSNFLLAWDIHMKGAGNTGSSSSTLTGTSRHWRQTNNVMKPKAFFCHLILLLLFNPNEQSTIIECQAKNIKYHGMGDWWVFMRILYFANYEFDSLTLTCMWGVLQRQHHVSPLPFSISLGYVYKYGDQKI